jgi:hypothetical protein
MTHRDFHVALANALDRAMPPEVPQEYDMDVVADQCVALLERAGWAFSRMPLATRRREPVLGSTGVTTPGHVDARAGADRRASRSNSRTRSSRQVGRWRAMFWLSRKTLAVS